MTVMLLTRLRQQLTQVPWKQAMTDNIAGNGRGCDDSGWQWLMTTVIATAMAPIMTLAVPVAAVSEGGDLWKWLQWRQK